MNWSRPATHEEHDEFCNIEGWMLLRGARVKPVEHHRTYKLVLSDGRVFRARLFRPIDSSQYARSMWSYMLREQLSVTENEFWDCMGHGSLPDRNIAAGQRPGLPYCLTVEVQRTCGLSADETAELSESEAKPMIAEHWANMASNEEEWMGSRNANWRSDVQLRNQPDRAEISFEGQRPWKPDPGFRSLGRP